jgi:signal peptidase II
VTTARRTAFLVVLVVAMDQATKALAAGPGRGIRLIHPLRNPAFSLQIADAGRWTELLAMLALLGAAVAVATRLGTKAGVPSWATGLILGGAAGNLLDRAILGSVRDFLLTGPVVINLADVAVLLGLAVAYGSWATGTFYPLSARRRGHTRSRGNAPCTNDLPTPPESPTPA